MVCQRAAEVMNIAFELKAYIEMRHTTEQAMVEIDGLLNHISKDKGCEMHGRVLRLWYIEGLPKEKILCELNYSSLTSIYELKNEAIRKFTVNLFGYEALKAI